MVITSAAAWFTDSRDDVLYKIPIASNGAIGTPVAVPLTGDFTLAAGFNPGTYLNAVQVPGRSWNTTEGVTTVSFTATVPITGGVYSNPLVTATYEITSLTLVDTAPVTVEQAITGLTLTNSSPTSLGQATILTTTITGGNDGLSGVSTADLFGAFPFDLFGETAYLYCLGVLFLAWWLARSAYDQLGWVVAP